MSGLVIRAQADFYVRYPDEVYLRQVRKFVDNAAKAPKMMDRSSSGKPPGPSRGARFVCLSAIGASVIVVAAARQAPADPLAGKWELNVARTHYGGGAELRIRESFTCDVAGADVRCTIRSVRADGRIVLGGFTATYDGAPGPTRGISDVDSVRLTKVNESVADATFALHDHAVFAYRAVRSADGRSLTIISVDPTSRAVLNSVVVYDRR